MIGASGNDATCAAEGFLLTSFGWAESLYYASLSVYTLMAVKHNFREQRYQCIEKWIHGISIGVPFVFSIVGAVGSFFEAGLAFCHLTFVKSCDPSVNGDLQECTGGREKLLFHVPYIWIIAVSFLTSSGAMIYLYHSFEQTEDDVDHAVGMRLLIQSAKKQKLKEVMQQLGLYLFSCWFGYIVLIVWTIIYFATGNLNYPLMTTYHCMNSFQGFIIMVIYFSLINTRQNQNAPTLLVSQRRDLGESKKCNQNYQNQKRKRHYTTVESIRAKAAKTRKSKKTTIMGKFSFCIFDGSPHEDSPWAKYLGNEGQMDMDEENEERGMILDVENLSGERADDVILIRDEELDRGALLTSPLLEESEHESSLN